ncbi:MAG: group II intron reverse transcriptase domain-containing protein [Selenomonadaceae bacterium]|nr:group II intron reverse transcriptase domain-containing protein [Selenomonadaceae bacterium]MBP3722366.1 group II intron reverse transcriptase domain-containing protein [Selenomonadaceae bacterium]
MKRYDGLFDIIVEPENLYAAFENAREGRHFKNEIMETAARIEEKLKDLRFDLLVGKWNPGGYHQFECQTEVKRRIINAPVFIDRIVHHAIVQVVMPLFEKKFIHDSYACRLKPKRYCGEKEFEFERRKKGTHRAVKRLQHFLRSAEDTSENGRAYVLQCDISKYYLTIDHEILKRELRRTIADRRLLEVWDKMIEGYHEPMNPTIRQILLRDMDRSGADEKTLFEYALKLDTTPPEKTGKGVPIGALTSQLEANIYLNPLDHFVKEILGARYYLRYMDDFIIVAGTKEELKEHLLAVRWFIEERLNLSLNPKTQIFPATRGVDFAGYRTFRDYILPRKRNIKAAKIRFKNLSHQYKFGRADLEDVKPRVASFLGYIKHCKASRTSDSTLAHLVLCRGEIKR